METAFERPPKELVQQLKEIAAATVCGQLLKLGFTNTYMTGIRPLLPGTKIVGPAITVRYVPSREDLLDISPEERPLLADFRAVEMVESGDIIVCDVAGCCGASTFGDCMLTRVQVRGGSGLVVDGAVRDLPFIKKLSMPVFVRGLHDAPGPRAIWPADLNVPIQCGGVLVTPGDIIVADDDGVVVVPRGKLRQVVEMGLEEEALEAFVRNKMRAEGVPIGEFYPPTEKTKRALLASQHQED